MSRVKEGTTQKRISRGRIQSKRPWGGEGGGQGQGRWSRGGGWRGVPWQEDRELGGRCLQSFGSRVEMSDFVPSVCGSH